MSNETTHDTMPAAIEAERAILGAVLVDNTNYADAAAGLSVDDLTLDSHRRIYRQIIDLIEDGKPADLVTVFQSLGVAGDLEKVGGAAYIASLTDGVTKRQNLSHYVDILRDKSKLRRLIMAGHALVTRAHQQEEPAEIIADVQKMLTEIVFDIRMNRDTGAQALGVEIKQYLCELRKVDPTRDALGFRTGIRKLDIITGGLFRKELTIIGAWTGDGKTSLAEQITVANLVDDVGVGWFSLEMFRVAIGLKLIAKFQVNDKITAARLRDPRELDLFDVDTIEKFIDQQLGRYNLHIDDTRGLTLNDMLSRARVMVRKHGCRMIIVDYLKLLRVPAAKGNTERLSTVSGELLTFSGREDCQVIGLSQLAVPEGKRKRKPTLFDIKESGDVSNDANTILFPYRPIFDEEGQRKNHRKYTGGDLIVVDKQRAGATGDVLVSWNDDLLRFDERQEKHQDE